jgi:arginyl-tRNA synthetase
MEIQNRVEAIIKRSLEGCLKKGVLPLESVPETVALEQPKRAEHGDYATNICMQLARQAKMNPRQIATLLCENLDDPDGLLEGFEIAGPGFVNLRVKAVHWLEASKVIVTEGLKFGSSNVGDGQRVLVEFVSANPTGPLHVGHGRGAVIGDTVAALLQATGFSVDREYYINDVGNQMNILGRSLYVRYRQACGVEEEFPENHYKGDYVFEIASAFKEKHGDSLVEHDYEADSEPFLSFIKDRLLVGIKEDLDGLGVTMNRWFSEKSLHDSGRLDTSIEKLKQNGHLRSDEEGRQWFNSSAYGDTDDRVVVRGNGVKTYFAADIAYHDEKIERGYDLCIDVWGADHHGYIPRVKGAIAGLGHNPERLEILLYQFVRLVRGGEPVRMSTRAGEFELLSDLVKEVGKDATRYNFVMRKSDAQFDFDLELATKQSMDNPVYYIQYGHARICQIIAKGLEAGHSVPTVEEVDLSPLVLDEEIMLIKKALDYPWVIRSAAAAREVHFLPVYLQELISMFHAYYTRYKHTEKVVSDNREKTSARLFMCECLRVVLANSLNLLGVEAPQRMYFTA